MSPVCTRTPRMVGTFACGQVTATIGPRRTSSHALIKSTLSTRRHTNAFTLASSLWSPTRLDVFTRTPSACFTTSPLFKPPATSTTKASSGARDRTIALAIGAHLSFVASKQTWASFSPLSARSSGTLQLVSLFFLQGRVAREGGVVAVTSRYT